MLETPRTSAGMPHATRTTRNVGLEVPLLKLATAEMAEVVFSHCNPAPGKGAWVEAEFRH